MTDFLNGLRFDCGSYDTDVAEDGRRSGWRPRLAGFLRMVFSPAIRTGDLLLGLTARAPGIGRGFLEASVACQENKI